MGTLGSDAEAVQGDGQVDKAGTTGGADTDGFLGGVGDGGKFGQVVLRIDHQKEGVAAGGGQAEADAAVAPLSGRNAGVGEGAEFCTAVVRVAVVQVGRERAGVALTHVGDGRSEGDAFARLGIGRGDGQVFGQHHQIGRCFGPDAENGAVVGLVYFVNGIARINVNGQLVLTGRGQRRDDKDGLPRTAGGNGSNGLFSGSCAVVQQADSDVGGGFQADVGDCCGNADADADGRGGRQNGDVGWQHGQVGLDVGQCPQGECRGVGIVVPGTVGGLGGGEISECVLQGQIVCLPGFDQSA